MNNRVHPAHLPQVSAPFTFIVDNLNDMNINYKLVKVQASRLKPMQDDVQFDLVNKLSGKWKNGEDFDPIFISDDNYICDGHHRAASKISAEGKDAKIKAIKILKPHNELPHLLGRIQDRWDISEEYEKEMKTLNEKIGENSSVVNFKELKYEAQSDKGANKILNKIMNEIEVNTGMDRIEVLTYLNKKDPVVLFVTPDGIKLNKNIMYKGLDDDDLFYPKNRYIIQDKMKEEKEVKSYRDLQ
jgi:hypothetical protein